MTNLTAAELIVSRADNNEPNMALTSWIGTIVRKQDIFIAKNYLTKDELDTLNRLVVIFLETAELRTKNKEQLSMQFWKGNVDRMLDFNDKKILSTKGKISKKEMEQKTLEIYNLFDTKRKQMEVEESDLKELEELKNILTANKNKEN